MSVQWSKTELVGKRTGSSFINFAQNLARREHQGRELTEFERAQVALAVEVWGPENFYMDGELFA